MFVHMAFLWRKIAYDGRKMAQDGAKMVPSWPKMARRWPKMAPRSPKKVPRWLQEGVKIGLKSLFSYWFCFANSLFPGPAPLPLPPPHHHHHHDYHHHHPLVWPLLLVGDIIGRPDSMYMCCPHNIGRDSWDRGEHKSAVELDPSSPHEVGEEALAECSP